MMSNKQNFDMDANIQLVGIFLYYNGIKPIIDTWLWLQPTRYH